MFGTDRGTLPPAGDCKVNAFFNLQSPGRGGMSGNGGGGEGDGSGDGVIAWLTTDQLEEHEISEEKICQKSTCGEGSRVGLQPGVKSET